MGFNFAAAWVPSVRKQIKGEMDKLKHDCERQFGDARKATAVKDMPDTGMSQEAIIDRIRKGAEGSEKLWTNESGNLAGGIYYKDAKHWDFVSEVIRLTVVSNPLHMKEFQYIAQMEAEIIRWTLNLYKGDAEACGLCASGGTESIVLAMLAYREQAKQERGITQPNLVMSETAHPSHDKAGHFFGIEVRKIPITKDFRADLNAMRSAIDSNTIVLIASAPEYAFGNYDPINDIAALAQSYGIGCHCDCCLGSFVNPFIKPLGFAVPYQFDFTVPGITSITADPHKYAQGPKGCSVLMFKTKALRDYQFFVCADWSGGLYATTSLAGARPGAMIAGNWAAMAKAGKKGFAKQAKSILTTQQNLRNAFKDDPDITVSSHTASPIFSFTSTTVNVIAMSDLMAKKFNWTLHKVQNPPSGHLTVTNATENHWQDFVKAIKQCTEMMKADPSLNTN